MRGAGEQYSVGERIAFYRRRRGTTQRVLAELVGRSEDWLSKIERGDRDIHRLDVLGDVARQLRVGIGDLLGQPVLMEDTQPSDDDIPAIRRALMSHQRLSRTLFAVTLTRPVDVGRVEQLSDFGWRDYQGGRLGNVVAALPGLITSAQALEESQLAGGFRASSRIHHLCASTLAKVGEADLAWIAAERAMSAGERSGSPLALASAARAGTHALLSVGRYDDALNLGETAADWLSNQTTQENHEALSLIGMLALGTAVAAARNQDRSLTNALLAKAQRAADTIGMDVNHWYTSFGPTNVALHRVAVSLDLQDLDYVLDKGPLIDASALPEERTVTHLLALARASSYVARDEEALARLLTAESSAPQIVRHSAEARETVKTLHRRARHNAGTGSPLAELAIRCRAIA